MWGDDDDGVVTIFEDDHPTPTVRAKESEQKGTYSKETLLFAPVLRAWISTTREITAEDAFRCVRSRAMQLLQCSVTVFAADDCPFK